jgi:hypothetical protein
MLRTNTVVRLAAPKKGVHMQTQSFDTKQGISAALSSLSDFHEVLRKRRDARERDVRLNEHVVLGRFRLDTFGQVWFPNKVAADLIASSIPSVVSSKEYTTLLERAARESGVEYCESWGMGGSNIIAPAGVSCAVCGREWSIQDCHDCVYESECVTVPVEEFIGKPVAELCAHLAERRDVEYFPDMNHGLRNDRFIDLSKETFGGSSHFPKNELGWVALKDVGGDQYVIQSGDDISIERLRYYHRACKAGVLRETVESRFRGVFHDAGFAWAHLTETENEYGSAEYRGPWYHVHTSIGWFRIGWRKRVIEIDWGRIDADLAHLFVDEEVTKGFSYIHAWGYGKAAEYIKRIHSELQQKKK